MLKQTDQTKREIRTAGEILPDNTVLELLCDPSTEELRLLHRKAESDCVAPSIFHNGIEYAPIEIDPGISPGQFLPSSVGSEEPNAKLLQDVFNLFRCFKQPPATTLKLTLFSITSWFNGGRRVSPFAWVTAGSGSPKHDVLRVMTLACRRPLCLTGLGRADLACLPWKLNPTLILNECDMNRRFLRLLWASSRQETKRIHHGRMLPLYGSKIVFSEELPGDLISKSDMLHISLIPSNAASFLDDKMEKKIWDEFQPRLTAFRLRNLACPHVPQSDISMLSPSTQEFARALLAAVGGDEIFQKAIVQMLTREEKQYRLDRSMTTEAVLLEAILWFCHQPNQDQLRLKVRSAELAEKVNAILAGRGSSEEVSPETIGRMLTRLGIPRLRIGSAGNGIELTNSVRRTVHQIALSLCASGTLENPKCIHCQELVHPDPLAQPAKPLESVGL